MNSFKFIKMKILKVSTPLTQDGVKGWVFKLVCPGYAMSISHDRLLLLKNATVNGNLDFVTVCKERHVFIGYWTQDQTLKVDRTTGKVMKYPPIKNVLSVQHVIAQEWEIQTMFFEQNNIKGHWILHTSQALMNSTMPGMLTGPGGELETMHIAYSY